MTRRLASALRTVAIICAHLAQTLDPEPDVEGVWPFEVHTSTGTTAHEARITWHSVG